jgi:hypothetical protein
VEEPEDSEDGAGTDQENGTDRGGTTKPKRFREHFEKPSETGLACDW